MDRTQAGDKIKKTPKTNDNDGASESKGPPRSCQLRYLNHEATCGMIMFNELYVPMKQ